MKKKFVNWLMLVAILTLILFGTRWAMNKRQSWLNNQNQEALP